MAVLVLPCNKLEIKRYLVLFVCLTGCKTLPKLIIHGAVFNKVYIAVLPKTGIF